ncbi:MAG: hypothetical protein ACXAEX_05690 [Promethearchaeota archaeon]
MIFDICSISNSSISNKVLKNEEECIMDTILFYFETDDFRSVKLRIPKDSKHEEEKINLEIIHKGGRIIWKK